MRLAEKMRAILKKTSQINSLKPWIKLEILLQIALKLFHSNKLLKYAIMSTFFDLKFGLHNNSNRYDLYIEGKNLCFQNLGFAPSLPGCMCN